MAMAHHEASVRPADRKLIIACDWNGTIADDAMRAVSATSATLQALGHEPIERSRFRSAFRLPLADFFRELGVHPEQCGEAVQRWNHEMLARDGVRLSVGVTELLAEAELLNVAVGVISAAGEEVVHRDIARLNLGGRFSFVVGGVTSKRDVLAILVAIANTVVYVGDTEFDLSEARSAGASTIAFSGGYRPVEALMAADPDWHVASLMDVSSIIRRLAG
jgi:phosphoglycolate phosphatase-like HAD superfamily hydrolase